MRIADLNHWQKKAIKKTWETDREHQQNRGLGSEAAGLVGLVLDIFVMAWLGNRMRNWMNNHKVLGK